MPFATSPRSFPSRLLAVLVVCAGLASSCQTSRPSYSFQPAPGRAQTVAVVPVVLAAAAAESVPAAQMPVAATGPAEARTALRPRHQKTLEPISLTPKAAAAHALATPVSVAVRRHRGWFQRPHTTAEAGLGTTVLGVLGLIMLPIAALGIILTGGALGWIIVGGLAAVAVLVAYLDPDRR